MLFGWKHQQPLCYFTAHWWYLLSGEHSLMNLAKSCWLTFPCWRHDFISAVWKWAPARQVISMSQLEDHIANVFPNISLSVPCYYFQVYQRTITFIFFLLSSCTSKTQFILLCFFPVTLYAANIKQTNKQIKKFFFKEQGRKAPKDVFTNRC